jgi:hypothetical protein
MLPPFPHPPPPPRRELRVSIVITNRDYASFLPAALASALGQHDADVEVIVVDDGSTDGSREIIERHRDHLRAVLLDGRGQKAAFNAGFGEVSGDVVMFLDADDELGPGTAAAVADAFARNPAAARVVFRLEVVDEHDQPTGARVPSAAVALAAGDVRRAVLAFPDDLGWPPTSGNAFATWALRRVMPIPLDDERTGADSWLHPLVPLLGPVVALDGIHGAYRVHGANAHAGGGIDVDRSRLILRRARGSHARIAELAGELGLGPARPRSVTIAAHRLLSLRLGGDGHPVAGDSRRRALGAGLRAAQSRFDVSPAQRLAYAAWFVLVALAPERVVRALGETFLQPLRPSRLARSVGGS